MRKNTIKLTESDLNKIVRKTVNKVVNEENLNEFGVKDALKTAGAGVLGAAGVLGTLGTDNLVSKNLEGQFKDRIEMRQSSPELRQNLDQELRALSWEEANKSPEYEEEAPFAENLIRRAVTESVRNLFKNEVAKRPGKRMLREMTSYMEEWVSELDNSIRELGGRAKVDYDDMMNSICVIADRNDYATWTGVFFFMYQSDMDAEVKKISQAPAAGNYLRVYIGTR